MSSALLLLHEGLVYVDNTKNSAIITKYNRKEQKIDQKRTKKIDPQIKKILNRQENELTNNKTSCKTCEKEE